VVVETRSCVEEKAQKRAANRIRQGMTHECESAMVRIARSLEAEIRTVDDECDRLTTAIAIGGSLDRLLNALETARAATRRDASRARDVTRHKRLQASENATVRNELVALSTDWRHVLADQPTTARPIVSTARDDNRWAVVDPLGGLRGLRRGSRVRSPTTTTTCPS
jgi:hypothetical protein